MLNFDLSYLSQTSPVSRQSDEETDTSSVRDEELELSSSGPSGIQSGGEEVQSPPLTDVRAKVLSRINSFKRPQTSTPQVRFLG